jgi:CSLREA domain-containing protein
MLFRGNHLWLRGMGLFCALVLALVGVVMLVSPAVSDARTFVVNNRNDIPDQNPGDGICKAVETGLLGCTLRAAIMEANAFPGADTITLGRGTYQLTLSGISTEKAGAVGDLDITDKLIILGTTDENGEPLTIIDATQLSDRIFDIQDSSVVVMKDMTLTNGTVFRQGREDQQNVEFSCPVIEPTDKGDGGAILNRGGIVMLTNLNFEGNLAQCDGGAIDNISDGIMLLTNCNFNYNTAGRDGGAMENDDDSMMTISGGQFEWNNAYENGGALSNNDSMITIKRAKMRYNSALVFGGALWNGDSDPMTISGTTIMYNKAEDGGGIWNNDGFLNLRFNIIWMNAPNDTVDNNIQEGLPQ